jgi:hypothetical protein
MNHTNMLNQETMLQYNCTKIGLLSCLGVKLLSLPSVVLPFPQFVLLNSIPCVELGLTTFLENCNCVAVAIFLGVTSPTERVDQ